MKRFLIACVAACIGAPAAFADGREILAGMDCPASGRITVSELRDALLMESGLPPSSELSRLIVAKPPEEMLGDRAMRDANENAHKKPLDLAALFETTSDLMLDRTIADLARDDIIVTISPTSPTETGRPADRAVARARALLNNDSGLLTITCKYVAPPPQPAGDGKKGGKKPLEWIVGETKADMARKKLGDSEFATLSLKSEDGETTITSKFAVGLGPQPFIGGSSWSPYLQYNRKTSDDPEKDTNEVSLGASFIYSLLDYATYSSASWQTDDHGDASVLNADTRIVLPTDFCVQPKVGWYIRCRAELAADYVYVDDAGANPNWTDQLDYFRAGGDVTFSINHKAGPGLVSLSAGYKARFDISDDDATAELFEAGIAYEPEDESHFRFGVTYENGKDPATLSETDVFSINIGYRQ